MSVLLIFGRLFTRTELGQGLVAWLGFGDVKAVWKRDV